MTPDELKQWRETEMGWTREQAATVLGVTLRTYAYLESGTTSAGYRREQIPLRYERAIADIRRTKPRPPPTRRLGRPVSEHTRQKISEAQRKRLQGETEETRQRYTEPAHRARKRLAAERRGQP